MQWELVQLESQEYTSALIMKWDDREEAVLNMVKKCWAYADAVHGPTQAKFAAVETPVQKLKDKIEENCKKLREEIKDNLLPSPSSTDQKFWPQMQTSSRWREKIHPMSWAVLFPAWLWRKHELVGWKIYCCCGERDVWIAGQQDTERKFFKKEAAPVACSQTAKYDDDMSNPLKETSKTYAQGKKKNWV